MFYKVVLKLVYVAVLHYRGSELVQLAQLNPAPTPWFLLLARLLVSLLPHVLEGSLGALPGRRPAYSVTCEVASLVEMFFIFESLGQQRKPEGEIKHRSQCCLLPWWAGDFQVSLRSVFHWSRLWKSVGSCIRRA